MPRIRRPLCFAAGFYALGLLLAQYAKWPYAVMTCALLGLCALGLLGRRSVLPMLLACFVCLGAWRMDTVRAYPSSTQPVSITGRVVERVRMQEDYGIVLLDTVCTDAGDPIAPGERIRLSLAVTPDHMPGVGGVLAASAVQLHALKDQRNPGGFDQYGYLRSRGVAMTASTGAEWTYTPPDGMTAFGMLAALRDAVQARIDMLFTYTAPLYSGMLLGNKQGIDDAVYADLRDSGIAHLLAVSGLHVSALIGFALFVLGRVRFSLRMGSAVLLALLWGYALLTGLGASTLRACVMGTMLIGARALNERYDAPTALAAAFLLMTLVRPSYIRDTGFVLSFSTVGGILLLYPTCQKLFARLPGKTGEALAIAVSAQLACMPFSVMYFGQISLIGFFINLLCVPLATMLVVSGMLLLVLSFPLMPVAALFAPVLRLGATALQGLAQAASNIPLATLRLAAPDAWLIAAFYGACFLASPYFDRRLGTRLAAGGILGCAALAIAILLHAPAQTQYVQLDVGQGDSAVLRSDQGAVLVVDTGPTGNTELTGYLQNEGISVDVLMLTHLDSDHAGGLLPLAYARIPVGQIWVPYGIDVQATAPDVLEAITLLTERGSVLCAGAPGDSFSMPGIEVQVLGPSNTARGSNDRSLVTRIVSQGVTILSMGDVPQKNEPLRQIACDVLKVSHHGSASGTSELFLEWAHPSLALISVGRNTFSHPNEAVLGRLADAGARILRTDQCGAITLTLENGAYEAKTMFGSEEREPVGFSGFLSVAQGS